LTVVVVLEEGGCHKLWTVVVINDDRVCASVGCGRRWL